MSGSYDDYNCKGCGKVMLQDQGVCFNCGKIVFD